MEVDGVPLVASPPGEFFWEDEQEDRSFWEQALDSLACRSADEACGYVDNLSDLLVSETDLFLDCGSSKENGSRASVEQGQESRILWDAGSGVHQNTTGHEDVTCGSATRLVEEWFVPQPSTGCSQEVEEDECLDEIVLSPRLVHPEAKVANATEFEEVSERTRPIAGTKRSRAAGVVLESLDSRKFEGIESVDVNFQAAGSSSGEEIADASVHDKGGASNVQTPTSSPEDPDSKRQIRLLRNRESASQSRARKKSYMKDLEAKCRMLENHVSQLQRAMTASAMENMALRQELMQAKKLKESGLKSGVAEPAVLESNSLPLEFLPHHSYQCPTELQYHTSGRYHRWLVALVQLLLLTVVREPNMSQASPRQLYEAHSSLCWSMSHSMGFQALSSHRAGGSFAFPGPGHQRKRRRKISGLQVYEHFMGSLNTLLPEVRRVFKQKRYRIKRRIKRLSPGRSSMKDLY